MKRIIHIFIAGLMISSAISCMDAAAIQSREALEKASIAKFVKVKSPIDLGKINKLSVVDFNQAIVNKKGILVDVRTPEEFIDGHIEGAININFKKRTFPSYISSLEKDKPVLIYCGSGNRSGKAALIMQSLGFKEINELAKGIIGWKASSMKLVSTNNEANLTLNKSLAKESPKPVALSHLGMSKNLVVDAFEQILKKKPHTLIDVRTPAEFADGHIAGAINIDWKNRNFNTKIIKVSNDRPVALYCGSGNRSTRAMFNMQALGFNEIVNLDQGFKSWMSAKKPIKTLEVKGDVRHLDVENFNNAILGNVGTLIDVRTPREFMPAHIPGAININYKNSNFVSECSKLDKSKPVMIYCRSGARSGRAMKALEKAGFKVYNLNRGFMKWKAAGMKLEGTNVNVKDGGEEGC